jgi:acyl-CoA dehydrogenase
VINGQKVWSSNAQFGDIGLLVCRTNPDVPKHRGITVFLVDLASDGVEVRPLRQMTGASHFNEVFLSDVFIPDEQRLGEVDDGWRVAITTLMNERASIGAGWNGVADAIGPTRLSAMIQHLGLADDAVIRQQLAALYVGYEVAEWASQHTLERVQAGRQPGPELSMAKLTVTENMTAAGDLAAMILGLRGVAETGQWGTFSWSQIVLGTPGTHIGGGTDEIQRTILAERVLGLPREPGSDNTVPFREIPRGPRR